MSDPNFHGVMYVKGHAQDTNCRRTVQDGEAAEPLDFAVKFDTCGLFHSDVSSHESHSLIWKKWKLFYFGNIHNYVCTTKYMVRSAY